MVLKDTNKSFYSMPFPESFWSGEKGKERKGGLPTRCLFLSLLMPGFPHSPVCGFVYRPSFFLMSLGRASLWTRMVIVF